MDISGGSGKKADVTENNQLQVYGPGLSIAAWAAIEDGLVWSCEIGPALSATAADDYIVYMFNTGIRPIAVVNIELTELTTPPQQIEVHHVTGTAAGGTDVIPTTRLLGGLAAPFVYQTGADITGLSKVGTLDHVSLSISGFQFVKEMYEKPIIIPINASIAFLSKLATGSLTGTIDVVQL
jgi:hypothetical protein